MPATLTRDTLLRDLAPASERGRSRPSAARSVVPTSNAVLARLGRGGDALPAARANLVGPVGNQVARATLAVSHPSDPAEREAEAVASRIAHGGSPPAAALARTPDAGLARTSVDREEAAPTAPASDVAAGGELAVSDQVSSLIASPGAGVPMDAGVQARVGPHLGADLASVRVHQGPEVSAAAAELQARAFTVGAEIFLGEGESPADLELMAHEATHVVQQQAVGVYREGPVMRSVADYAPDWILDPIRSLPGYSMVGVVIGEDPLTGESASESRQAFVEKLLTYGPFGAAIGPVLSAIDVLDDIFTLLGEALARHNLTLSRIVRDFEAAWDEMSITEGIDYNIAIARRYLDGILSDLSAFIDEVLDAVLTKVRAVIAAAVQPLLERESVAPWWNLATKVLHQNPLTGEPVQATTVEIITDFLKVAGQEQVLAQMTERQILQKTADWVDSKIDQFQSLVGDVGALLERAKDALTPANLPTLLDTLPGLADEAVALIRRIGDFAQDVLLTVLDLVKESLLEWLSGYAKQLPGYELLTVMLQQDPFTKAKVLRTAENLIKGFILLLPGGEEMYAKLSESGVIANAAARIESAMTELDISWDMITATFAGVWDLVTLEKLLTPLATFDEILAKFGDPLERIIRFAAVVIQVIIELILRMMNFPPELLGNIIDNAMAAIDDIKRDPVAFLMNVLEAMKQGFSAFFDKIAGYLLQGLSDWMFRGLRTLGIEPPTALTLEAAITLVIQVSGVTVESLWAKLGAKIGDDKVEKIRAAIELAGEAFAFIKDIQERGMAAIWDKISEQLSNLWDLIFDAAKQWLMSEIIDKAVAKVLSMLDPTGIMAVVRSAQAIFNAVQSVLDYARELLELIDSYVSTVASIAKGDVAPGAAKLEKGLADALPVAIGFLANQAGVGDLPEKVKEIVIGLRAKIDEAIDWLLDRAVALGRAALDALGMGGSDDEAPEPPLVIDELVTFEGAPHHVRDDGSNHGLVMHSDPVPLEQMPHTEVQAEVAAYRAARTAYDAARAAYDAEPAGHKTVPTKQALVAARDAVNVAVRALVLKMQGGGRLGSPMASAPGVGNIEKHGSQPQTIRFPGSHPNTIIANDPVWQTESEHILPFSVGVELWRAARLLRPMRGDLADDAQTTLVIYYGAARWKTARDLPLIAPARQVSSSQVAALRAAQSAAWLAFKGTEMRSPTWSEMLEVPGMKDLTVAHLEAVLDANLDASSALAVARTNEAITTENTAVVPPFTDPNGVRRGGEAPVPDSSAVDAAAAQQVQDIRTLVHAALERELAD